MKSLRLTLASEAPRSCAPVARRLLGDPDLWAPDDDLHALECPWCGALLERRYAPAGALVHALAPELDRALTALTSPLACLADPPFAAPTARALVMGRGDDADLDRFARHLSTCRSCTTAGADVLGPPPEAAIGDALVAWSATTRPAPPPAPVTEETFERFDRGTDQGLPWAVTLSDGLSRVLGTDAPPPVRLQTEDGRYQLAPLDSHRYLVVGVGIDDPWGRLVRIVARKQGCPVQFVEGQVTSAGVLTLHPEDPDLVRLFEEGFTIEVLLP
jgi:hypothetical protein